MADRRDAPSPPDPATLDAALSATRDAIRSGRAGIVDAARRLGAFLPGVTDARTRGTVNQALWDAMKALGERPLHFSQAGQDAFLDTRIFRGRRDGVFVEIGGYDGVTGSNCLFFELMRGWSGVLVEPSPAQFAAASAVRRCPCLAVAVGGAEGEAEFLDVQAGFSQMSGLVESYDPGLRARVEADPRHRGEIIRVPVRPLAAILDEQGIARADYVSLDVEGGEMAVLSAFPFERFEITAWTIENNTGSTEVPQFMAAKGYRRIEALGVDDVYVRAG